MASLFAPLLNHSITISACYIIHLNLSVISFSHLSISLLNIHGSFSKGRTSFSLVNQIHRVFHIDHCPPTVVNSHCQVLWSFFFKSICSIYYKFSILKNVFTMLLWHYPMANLSSILLDNSSLSSVVEWIRPLQDMSVLFSRMNTLTYMSKGLCRYDPINDCGMGRLSRITLVGLT